MEIRLRNCILLAVMLLLISILFYTLKKIAIFAIILILSLLFFARSGILYMASNFEPPKISIPAEEKIEMEAPKVDISLPKVKYKYSGARGFGLDLLEDITN